MTPPRHRRHLVVFARNPIPGRVKTRLIPAMGLGPATAVYRRMLGDTLVTCSQVFAHSRELWIDQPGLHKSRPPLENLTQLPRRNQLMRQGNGGDGAHIIGAHGQRPVRMRVTSNSPSTRDPAQERRTRMGRST